jgi:hypothetical protein
MVIVRFKPFCGICGAPVTKADFRLGCPFFDLERDGENSEGEIWCPDCCERCFWDQLADPENVARKFCPRYKQRLEPPLNNG